MARVKVSAILGGLRGRLGNIVFVGQPNGGTTMREYSTGTNPRTPAQQQWRSAMRRAGKAYRNLSAGELQEWENYARGLVAAGERPPSTVNAFMKVAPRFAYLNPNAPIPTLPPVSTFGGDRVAVQVSAVTGGIRFSPSEANGTDISTQLLVQKLASANCQHYEEKFRVKATVAFGPATTVVVTPGWYVCAVRFVRTETGQSGPLLVVGKVQVSA